MRSHGRFHQLAWSAALPVAVLLETALAACSPDACCAPAPPAPGPIAFVSNRDGNYDIYVMNADGSGVTRLTSDTAPDYDWSPTWSPDGSKIAFWRGRQSVGGVEEIFVMSADGSGLRRLTSIPPNRNPQWAPDGSKIAFVTVRDWNSEIFVINADGSGLRNLTNNPANEDAPAWSPDGTKIAFTSDRDANGEIYVMNADGSSPTRFTNDDAWDGDPIWSPDGSKIAFVSGSWLDGDWQISTMNADGSGLTRLTNDGYASDCCLKWSPDGTRLLFQSTRDGGVFRLYVMNADGAGVVGLVPLVGGPICPGLPCSGVADWSPDGAKIVWGGSGGIYVVNADASGARNLTANTASDAAPAWRRRSP
jgi:Tol biopolymer transport system component